MLLELRIKLQSPILAAQNTRDGIRKFIRDSVNDIALSTDLWHYAFQQAAADLHMDKLDMDTIRLPAAFRAPKIDLFNRKYRIGDKGTLREAKHECINSGAELTVTIALASQSAPGTSDNLRPPTLDEFKRMLDLAGARYGFSPWGSGKTYGRFRVLHLKQVTHL